MGRGACLDNSKKRKSFDRVGNRTNIPRGFSPLTADYAARAVVEIGPCIPHFLEIRVNLFV